MQEFLGGPIFAHAWTALVIAVVGLVVMIRGGALGMGTCYISGDGWPSATQKRLDAVLVARDEAENIPRWHRVVQGAMYVIATALALVPAIPPVLPYAGLIVGQALLAWIAFTKFRQATEKRVAVLSPRHPLDALPPLVIALVGGSIAADLWLALTTAYAIPWMLLAIAAAALLIIAWNIATAPALILGTDPVLERYVDDRLRSVRALAAASVAAAPPIVLLGLTREFGTAGSTAWVIAVSTMLVSFWYIRRARSGPAPEVPVRIA